MSTIENSARIGRRNFGQLAGVLGAASVAGLASSAEAVAAVATFEVAGECGAAPNSGAIP